MKPANPSESPSKGAPRRGAAKALAQASASTQAAPQAPSDSTEKAAAAAAVDEKTGLGLSERRRSVRLLPVPEAVESNGDSEWAAFQALISDNQRI